MRSQNNGSRSVLPTVAPCGSISLITLQCPRLSPSRSRSLNLFTPIRACRRRKTLPTSVINAYPIPYIVLGYTGIGQPGGGANEVDFVNAISGGSSATSSALSGSTPLAHGGGYYTGSQLCTNLSAKSSFGAFSGARFPNPTAAPNYNSSQKYITVIASRGTALAGFKTPLRATCCSAKPPACPLALRLPSPRSG